MATYAMYSAFTMETVGQACGDGIAQLEQSLSASLTQIQNNPNPSMSQLATFQANLQLWSGMIQMESSIVKNYGDTMKQVVSNMGS